MERSEGAVAAFTESLRETGTTDILPEKLAAALGIAVADLAELAGVHHNALEDHASERLQHRLREIVRVISAATALTGDLSKAIVWYRNEPITDYRDRTTAELVAQGHAEAVVAICAILRTAPADEW